MKLHHESDHQKLRAEAYPTLTEQLDMLWHAMNEGSMPKAEPFFSSIQAVKDQYPKPGESKARVYRAAQLVDPDPLAE